MTITRMVTSAVSIHRDTGITTISSTPPSSTTGTISQSVLNILNNKDYASQSEHDSYTTKESIIQFQHKQHTNTTGTPPDTAHTFGKFETAKIIGRNLTPYKNTFAGNLEFWTRHHEVEWNWC